jgi:hypothetical protein
LSHRFSLIGLLRPWKKDNEHLFATAKRLLVLEALELCHDNFQDVAELLGCKRESISAYVKNAGIPVESRDPGTRTRLLLERVISGVYGDHNLDVAALRSSGQVLPVPGNGEHREPPDLLPGKPGGGGGKFNGHNVPRPPAGRDPIRFRDSIL